MPVNAEEYRLAAHERYKAAGHALTAGEFAVAHYLAGLAVECMLRAYWYRLDKEFDPRHDLYDLAKRSHFLDLITTDKSELGGAFNEINERWRNNHRYYPDKKLRGYLHKQGLTLLRHYRPYAREKRHQG